ncbi:hypothetical protein F4561_000960 [Lipingzhangella halophila]|uniref:Flp pilus-assembly TadE/G-like protein n=1 Tax=Lipingzhangella halophila TaxID=1783352 RepID=A0A7W7RE36_9ACTN|nr:pilus assembly protein TadG-related protein [Lipingzhangella halophila]MBB4930140.1 hypothetical protein [Lipingzhangella halophila]
MKLRLTSRQADEQGQASLFLLVGLTLSLLSLTLLFIRLGDVNEMRTTAQSAADSAALAAVGDIQHRTAQTIAGGSLPWGVGWQQSSGKPAAENYAEDNNATLTDIRASDNQQGQVGNIVRVEVEGTGCQRELKDDSSVHWNNRECPDKEELEEAKENGEEIPVATGNAAAIAEVRIPDCEQRQIFDVFDVVIGSYIACRPEGSGQPHTRVWTYGQAKDMTEVRLVDREGQWKYSELSAGPGSGRYPCEAVGDQNITKKMCATHEAIMDEWGAVFETYGVGCYRAGTKGEHPKGRACDYMVSDPNSGNPLPDAKHQRGADAAAQWMIDNHKELDIYYIIWEQHIWNPHNGEKVGEWDEVKRPMEDRGGSTVNHYDHIHVSVLP